MTSLNDLREKLRDNRDADHTTWTPQQFRAFIDELMRDVLDVEVTVSEELEAAKEKCEVVYQK